MNLDIETTVRVIFFLLLIGAAGLFVMALRAFQEAQRLRFFLKKRELLGRGWQFVFFTLLTVGFAFMINTFVEPLTYQVFPPSPTVTLTPTITVTPTITITPTITTTPTASDTPLFTPTPLMPAVISQEFTAKVTPNPEARFSELIFSRTINDENQALNPSEGFENPINTIYGTYSYENMVPGSQWTALWFRDGELVYYQTIPWNGGSGGFGYTDSDISSENWLPGTFEVRIFVGEIWKQSGTFDVIGSPPTPAPTETAVATQTLTSSPTSTANILPTKTETVQPTETVQATLTLTPTQMSAATATITPTPTETLIPTPTRRSTIFR